MQILYLVFHNSSFATLFQLLKTDFSTSVMHVYYIIGPIVIIKQPELKLCILEIKTLNLNTSIYS